MFSAAIAAAAENIGGITLVKHRVPEGTVADRMRKLALDVRSRVPALQPAVVMVTGVPADRPVVVIAVNEAGRGAGLSAGTLVGGAAKALGGGGGGKPDIAQGGGAPNAGAGEVNAAFEAVRIALRDSRRSGR
jgi:alanyl-tRNA synthetase